MGVLVWIVCGAVAGWLAALVLGPSDAGETIINLATGAVGGLVGGLAVNAAGPSEVIELNLPSVVVAILGAVSLVVVVDAVRRSRSRL